MIVKSTHKPYTFYLFRDDNTEVEFKKRTGEHARVVGDYKFSALDKKCVRNYFNKKHIYKS